MSSKSFLAVGAPTYTSYMYIKWNLLSLLYRHKMNLWSGCAQSANFLARKIIMLLRWEVGIGGNKWTHALLTKSNHSLGNSAARFLLQCQCRLRVFSIFGNLTRFSFCSPLPLRRDFLSVLAASAAVQVKSVNLLAIQNFVWSPLPLLLLIRLN